MPRPAASARTRSPRSSRSRISAHCAGRPRHLRAGLERAVRSRPRSANITVAFPVPAPTSSTRSAVAPAPANSTTSSTSAPGTTAGSVVQLGHPSEARVSAPVVHGTDQSTSRRLAPCGDDEAVLRHPRPRIRRVVPRPWPVRRSATARAGIEAVRALEPAVASLAPARTLDVACGTGFLTRHLRGEVTGLDQSERMLEIAHDRIPRRRFVQGDAIQLPFADGAFDRVFTGHFYGHLEGPARARRSWPRRARVAPGSSSSTRRSGPTTSARNGRSGC